MQPIVTIVSTECRDRSRTRARILSYRKILKNRYRKSVSVSRNDEAFSRERFLAREIEPSISAKRSGVTEDRGGGGREREIFFQLVRLINRLSAVRRRRFAEIRAIPVDLDLDLVQISKNAGQAK